MGGQASVRHQDLCLTQWTMCPTPRRRCEPKPEANLVHLRRQRQKVVVVQLQGNQLVKLEDRLGYHRQLVVGQVDVGLTAAMQ